MHTHGHTWDSRLIISRPARGLIWLQRLGQRLATYRAAYKQALLVRRKADWDARREQVRTSTTASALEYAADQGGPAMSLALYSAHTDMASAG